MIQLIYPSSKIKICYCTDSFRRRIHKEATTLVDEGAFKEHHMLLSSTVQDKDDKDYFRDLREFQNRVFRMYTQARKNLPKVIGGLGHCY
jgi:hypothetical protein